MANENAGKTIGEVSSKYNLSWRTLRFYEYRGIISPVRVGHSRFYTPKDIIRLELILKGKKFGFSLEEIRSLVKSDLKENFVPRSMIESCTVDKSERQIAHLEQQREKLARSIDELNEILSKRRA